MNFFVANFLAQKQSAKGAILIELAIALPVLLLLISGLTDLGLISRRANVVLVASRHAARSGGAMASRLSPTEKIFWCNNGNAEISVQSSCLVSPNLVPAQLPLKSAWYTGCQYLESEGFNRADWQVTAKAQKFVIPTTSQTRWQIRTELKQTNNSSSWCILCWMGLYNNINILETSTFPFQFTCS